MVERKRLNARLDALPENLESAAIERLLQRGVLVRDLDGRALSFWHNVVFDYAVSRLLLPDEPRDLIAFLNDDFERALYLRPSLRYRLLKQWETNRRAFWDEYRRVLEGTSTATKLYAAIVAPSVVVSEARRPEDLNELARIPGALTGTLLFLHTGAGWNAEIWSAYLAQLTSISDVNQAILITDTAKACLQGEPGKQVRIALNVIAHRLLAWCRKPEVSAIGLGTYHVVPLLVETFDSGEEESRRVLGELIDLARNDLSRNAHHVTVNKYREVQYFSHVIHLVSKVSGTLHESANTMQVVADTFPAGTLSG
ncbi:MAG: hypothetical protein EOO38_19590, partial [Cytophagaceae bacterium]